MALERGAGVIIVRWKLASSEAEVSYAVSALRCDSDRRRDFLASFREPEQLLFDSFCVGGAIENGIPLFLGPRWFNVSTSTVVKTASLFLVAHAICPLPK